MKYFTLLILSLFFFISCKNTKNTPNNCFEAKQLYIEFIPPFNFKETDTLYIDNQKFSHTYYLDSINIGNYLQKEEYIILQVEGKQAKEKTTNIGIARTLARKLKATGAYKILNGPELLTTGKLKIERVDKNKINVCSTPKYLAKLSPLN